MPIANISDHIFDRGKGGLVAIQGWLGKNVGPYLGRGEYPVIHIGAGWEIRSDSEPMAEGLAISWIVDITDEKKFMMYVLTWGT